MAEIVQQTRGCEILLVEDSLTQALQLQYILSRHGYTVTLARNGQEALEVLKTTRPMLVITDIVMPHVDGYQLCAAIKSNPHWKDIPVVLLTGLANPKDIVCGLRANADFYLTKPYNVEYLVSSIQTLLSNPLSEQDDHGEELEFTIGGEAYGIRTNRRRMLNLLLSIYGGAVQRNHELEVAQAQLQSAMQTLTEHQMKLEEANRKLEELVTLDGLTGVKNRRAFNERLEEELARAFRYGHDLSLLMLNVDHFKTFNDDFGHLEGDEILKTVGHMLREFSRETDFPARYGGEEFAVLLPHTDQIGTLSWAERFRALMREWNWPRRPVKISAGASTCRGSAGCAITPITLVDEADRALYHAKRTGRDRVIHFETLSSPA